MPTSRIRDLDAVMDAMLEVTPEPERSQLISRFAPIRKSLLYAAPEIRGTYWNLCAEALGEVLGERTEGDWRTQVAKIFSGQEESSFERSQ